jgi:phage gp36-like protein
MWISKQELKTHMDIDDIDVITGGDDTIITAAIDGAVSEAKSYLGSYDSDTIFNTSGSSRHALLLTFVKDIAVWHLIVLSNYKADLEFREKRYNRAVAWLKAVQKGDATPDLPATTNDYRTKITWGSNTRREQHF